MARPIVVQPDEQTRVPFLRGILTRSLQKAGLTFEESYRVASAVRDGLSSHGEITTGHLRTLVLSHLEALGPEVVSRYQNPSRPVATIIVESPEDGPTPYSRGRHSQDLLAAGLTADDAVAITDQLYVGLLTRRRSHISSDELRALTYDHIDTTLGFEAAQRYNVWQEFMDDSRPLVVLIGGAVGCGKSTIATELAHRLQIVRTQSSDMLREVMRTMISSRLLPILHESTYTAWTGLPRVQAGETEVRSDPPPGEADIKLLNEGFLSQSELVSVASDAVLRRAIQERVSIIVEGVHVHPSFARLIPEDSDAIVVHVMLAVLRKKKLKARIKGRGRQTPDRRAERYLTNFEAIWEIQSALLDEADRLGVPIVENDDKEVAVNEVVQVILDTLSTHYTGVLAEPRS